MGIQGLLQSLRPIQRTINISEYRGKTVAVDGHCILHRGGFGAATKLALNQPTDSYVNYFMQFMGLLEYHGVTPIVVFDGLPLPLKQITNDERRRNRQTALKQGLHLYEQGKIAAAEKFFQQSVSISNEMIIAVIRKLMEKKIQCIVAPNEADAQLTHLANTGKVDAVVTEDSDLLAFGCTKVIYKIDRYGDGIEICMDKVINDYRSTLYEYDAETIRHICILSGCDYLPSVKGVGLKTILKRYEINRNTDQALYHLQHQFKKDFPADYIEKFYFANLGFLHQWVYDMDEKNYVRLNPLPSECTEDDVRLLGRIPTVQDSTMFRVNKVIPKPKSKDTPLKEAITEEFLGYTQSAKENITVSAAPINCSKNAHETNEMHLL
ncbi:hypothetical protein MUCCIDRAFT_135323 [Mucor lusitanicus CBS 277.49]|uniref:Exonuclease 1 n=1 Tax=Mucor lusitanicus CBS 277.49 TaxID=747725 RepID=A0A168PFS8_MUCCL|nr:hypothetical protein MUCCIDRAFT_135323 [Mucor lusitanicus CBS 277.49]